MKKGLILEGGAMRGLFTAGVTDVFMENNITFDGTVGVSAGAVFGCNIKSGQTGRVIRYNTRFCKEPKYCSVRSLIKTGDLYGAEFCYHKLPDELDIFDKETYNKNPMEFYAVATDVYTGEAIYKRIDKVDYDAMEWLRASASMPLASRTVTLEGKTMLDGGMADSIPVKFFESIGYDKNVVILTQPKGYIKKKNKLIPLMKIALGKYKGIISAMEKRHIVYNETISYIEDKESRGELFVIRPPHKLEIGKIEHDPDKMRKAYDLGRKEGERVLPLVKEYLK